MKSLLFAKNASFVLTRLLIGALSALFISSFLARTLGPEGYGIYALAILCPMLAVAIGGLGLGPASVYFVSKGSFGLPEVVAKNIVISLATAGIVAMIGLVIVWSYGQELLPNVPLPLLVIALLMTFPMMMFGHLAAIFQGLQNFKEHGFFTLLPQVTSAMLLVGGFWLFGGKLTVAVLAWGGGYVLALAVVLYRFRAEIKLFFFSIKIRSHYLSESLKYGLKSHVGNLITFLNYRINVYLLGALAGTHAVGIYAVTVPVTEAIWLVSNAASAVLFPMVASLQAGHTSRNVTPMVCRWVLLVTVLAALFIGVASEQIVGIFFGAAFFQSTQAVLWLMPGVVLWALARVLSNDIAGRGRPDINLYISLGALFVNIIANLILIPKLGVNGAALASSISYSFLTVTVIFVYSRLLHVRVGELLLPSSDDVRIIRRLLGIIVNREGR
jgi:O-antigen/teichoic acid export membrane protein